MSESKTNALELTVSELSGKLKRTVEEMFGHVRVRGEISGFRGPHSSGHCYFSIKDEKARIEAVIWRGVASRLKFMPEEGLEMIASGKLTTYPGSSKYQIVIDNLEPAGAGALMVMLEERRKKLAAEGLFSDDRKQLLPFMPMVIGVVTSPTGAVIRDILHRLSDRFPLHVIVWPVRVQGESSGAEVANGIKQFNRFSDDDTFPVPDVIIVARGGGSLEDLWGFNDEVLVRAAADSMIPVISAVGHETDWTLIDHAADWRAPTPTAAAEKAVPVKAELEAQVAELGMRLRRIQVRLFEKFRNDIRHLARALPSPDALLALKRQSYDEAAGRLPRALSANTQQARNRFERAAPRLSARNLSERLKILRERLGRAERASKLGLFNLNQRNRARFDGSAKRLRPNFVAARISQEQKNLGGFTNRLHRAFTINFEARRSRFDELSRLLNSLSYNEVLARGFAVIRDANSQPLTSLAGAGAGDQVDIQMHDGHVTAIIENQGKSRARAKPIKPQKVTPKPKQKKSNEDQGQLF